MAVTRPVLRLWPAGIVLFCSTLLQAGVLPEDRADALYHSYDGGGVEINGPSVLVLKKFGENVALTGNYYVDSVSSASIDVVTSASPYSEKRTEVSTGVDYLHGSSTISMGYTNSDESDYRANTANFGISMDMFGNMTTLSMGYAHGWDTVEDNSNPDFSEDTTRRNFKLGISQVISRDMIMEVNYEGITDEGFLNNPYRTVRYVDPDSATGFSRTDEIYPRTRTSSALAVRSRYYLPWRASALGEYRFFSDTWGIDAHTLKLGYTYPFSGGWLLEGSYRFYTQGAADFYSFIFPSADAQNFLASDKELSEFRSHTFGVKLSHELFRDGWRSLDRASLNLSWDHIFFDYADFFDERNGKAYSFEADVLQLFLSAWF